MLVDLRTSCSKGQSSNMDYTRRNIVGFLFIGGILVLDGLILVEEKGSPDGMVWIEPGSFTMGSDSGLPDEKPTRMVDLSGFWIDTHEVTNADFETFVDTTDYITEAESFGDSLVFSKSTANSLRELVPLSWWHIIGDANWRQPEGPEDSIEAKQDHPVVQVSYADALAYCNWQDKTLPTEAQFEFAARGGKEGNIYSWGNQPVSHEHAHTNHWQGEFPIHNDNEDGYESTAPVGSFPANDYGLYDISGNVWEWVSDWYHPQSYELVGNDNPTGVKRTDSFDPNEPGLAKRSIRGGSFLCSENYCSGFRVSARMPADPETATNHTGFRCVKPTRTNSLQDIWLN